MHYFFYPEHSTISLECEILGKWKSGAKGRPFGRAHLFRWPSNVMELFGLVFHAFQDQLRNNKFDTIVLLLGAWIIFHEFPTLRKKRRTFLLAFMVGGFFNNVRSITLQPGAKHLLQNVTSSFFLNWLLVGPIHGFVFFFFIRKLIWTGIF